ncbi:hypothetical protein HPB47_011014 [Ixodes persulcatus]|uniref:Uncharacterized protein n=1 Tax=Ixodes persulcatus TaxID=34615 RepID=A0AC60NXI5_IXOPE|nr:hypothetical protein HPB47_011014 [Ixodes persulcatus]
MRPLLFPEKCCVVGDSNLVVCQEWSQSIFCRRSLAPTKPSPQLKAGARVAEHASRPQRPRLFQHATPDADAVRTPPPTHRLQAEPRAFRVAVYAGSCRRRSSDGMWGIGLKRPFFVQPPFHFCSVLSGRSGENVGEKGAKRLQNWKIVGQWCVVGVGFSFYLQLLAQRSVGELFDLFRKFDGCFD